MECKREPRGEIPCESCGGKHVKYRCPSCLRRTCSLQCVKDHKKAFNCTGIRCKTTYISKSDYKDSNMISDYRFLEDTERVSYTSHSNIHCKPRNFNRNAVNLVKRARTSGVTLKLMPVGMRKRRINTSHFNNREKCIMWRVKWLFPQAEAEYVDKRVSENEILDHLLNQYIDPKTSDPVIQQRLKSYFKTSSDAIRVFLKMEYQPANKERYYLLDRSQTLKQCLSNKIVIEFPTMHVVLLDQIDHYPEAGTENITNRTVTPALEAEAMI